VRNYNQQMSQPLPELNLQMPVLGGSASPNPGQSGGSSSSTPTGADDEKSNGSIKS